MTTANARIAMILAGLLILGLGPVAERASAESPPGFSQAELDQMLAPIALYPDTVLSHVLIAATYPLEVVQAARWSRANPGYAGEYAVEAVEHMPWDPSVMALVAFPELLARLDADLVWTQRLGDAFLVQEYQVLDTIQYLRDEAYAAGHLRSNEYVRVVREPSYIYIEPAVTRLVYVPYYDPRVVYGAWRWSAYPPVYWDHPRGYRSGFSFHWSSGYHVQPAFFFSSFHWSSRKVVVHNHYRYGHRDRGAYAYAGHKFSSGRELARYADARHWKHNPEHRRGVAYSRGIDERHAIKASNRSDRRVEDRRDLLRERSRSAASTAQRSIGRTSASDQRSRQALERTQRSRNALQRGQNNIREAAAAGPRSSSVANARSSSQRTGQPDTRRAAPDRASTRRELARGRSASVRSAPGPDTRATSRSRAKGTESHRQSNRASNHNSNRESSLASTRRELAQGRNSLGRSAPRTDSRAASPNRGRDVQARSPARKSASRAVQQSSARSRSAVTGRAANARSRPVTGSVKSSPRSSRPAISRESSQRATRPARQAAAPSRAVRAEAPTRARSRGNGSRAETLRSRGREGRQ